MVNYHLFYDDSLHTDFQLIQLLKPGSYLNPVCENNY